MSYPEISIEGETEFFFHGFLVSIVEDKEQWVYRCHSPELPGARYRGEASTKKEALEEAKSLVSKVKAFFETVNLI